ncbi:MAG TPA: hypothetical protein VFQ45_22185 [Longimicrobium sp.]|nr:hypothetical protein [Longimicrobium sp.]
MRSRLLLLLPALLLAPVPLIAQDDDDWEDEEEAWYEAPPARSFFGLNLTLAQPTGEFAQQVEGGIGGELSFLHRLDDAGWLALRIDGGLLLYGYERQHVPLSETVGHRIWVDLTTSNNIAFFGIGPQIGVPSGRFQPYVNAYAGYSYIYTQSSVSGSSYDYYDEPFATTTNFDDGTYSWGAGAGAYLPITSGRVPISMDLGIKWRNNGVAEYLREGDIQDNDDGTLTLYPQRSDTDLMTFHIGVTLGLRR